MPTVQDRGMPIADSCSAAIINYRTPDLTVRAIRSFRESYPDIPLLVIDNGSGDSSRAVLQAEADRYSATIKLIFNPSNIHHGPAMDQAIHSVNAPYLLLLDSDCEILDDGFLEQMVDCLERSPMGYAVGKLIYMNKRGFDTNPGPESFPYIRPICMVIRKSHYLVLPPFERHGAPCLRNMIEARKMGFELINFPIEQYVRHTGRGTAGQFGYHLGFRGKLNHFLHKLGF